MLERARSFDTVAELYDELRPRYPDALFDDLLELAGGTGPLTVLEVGTGPGVATLPLAERGCRVVGLEPGGNLASVARARLAAYPDVEIRETTFEDAPIAPSSFDLVVSASAWHWVDPAVGADKAAEVLRPGGGLALWWGHGTIVDPSTRADLREVHERWAPALAVTRYAEPGASPNDRVDDRVDDHAGRRRRSETALALRDHPAFGPVETRPHEFDTTYSAHQFVRLLDTYSDYRILDADTRQHLFDDVVEMIDRRHGGQVVRHYTPTLVFTRRVDG